MRFGRGVSSVSTSAAESKQRIRKVAVLPFTSIASEENQAWFADAVTQTLTTQLGKIQALSVIAIRGTMSGQKTSYPYRWSDPVVQVVR